MTTDKRTPLPLANNIQLAWKKYVELFGMTVHGTLPQIEAMLELLPDKRILAYDRSQEVIAELVEELKCWESAIQTSIGCDSAHHQYVKDLIAKATALQEKGEK